MSDTNPKTVRAKVMRDFNDAGTERRFAAREIVEVSEGEFANFAHAGLVEAAGEEPDASARPGEPAEANG